jgi:hypothetical protein
MGKVKELLEMSLPVFPSERRKLQEELNWENQKKDFVDPRDEDQDEYDHWRQLEDERFERMMNDYWENRNNQ